MQIKFSVRNIKETEPVRYFIKVTAPLSFTLLSVIKPINKNNQISK